MKQKFRLNCIITLSLLLLGAGLWFVPGIRFSALLTFGLAGMSFVWLLLGCWAEKSGTGLWCRRIFAAGCCGVVVLLGALEGLIITTAQRDMSTISADAIIILGAGVNGTRPSLTLRTRLDAARDYLERYPDIPVVLSGGQGPGEDITEARCMYDYLTERGVEPERLLLEERSTSTAENFAFSRLLLAEAGVDPEMDRIAFVTNDFHLYRAGLLAAREDYALAFGVPAELPWLYLELNYYIRESFALVKTLIFD